MRMPRRVCLAIAVSNVIPRSGASRFAYLDGAPLAAEAIGQWALRSGFGAENVRVITDQSLADGSPNPVTTQRVQAAVDELFPEAAAPTDHLIISFCGHGLTADVGTTFWLFSDSLERQYRINIEAFIYELLTFGIARVSLISDACRDAPKDLDLMRLDSRRGITGRPIERDSPMYDRLAACQDGQKAYMIVDPSSAAPGKCILSGVVLDVLWGHEPAAFINDKIDTHRFCTFTRQRASQRAQQYGFTLRPQCSVDPDAALLVDGSATLTPALELPPWPPAAQVISMGAITDAMASAVTSSEDSFERLHVSKAFRDQVLGSTFGASHPDIDSAREFPGLPDDARELVHQLFSLRQLQGPATPQIDVDISSTISALEGRAASYSREGAADVLRASLIRLNIPHSHVNLVVAGGHVLHLWAARPVTKMHHIGEEAQFRVEIGRADPGTQIVVEFEDGVLVPVYVYSKLFAVIVRSANGMTAIAYGGRDDILAEATHAIAELARGDLDSTRIEDLAARIRSGKHANPVLGAIAAYLYRQISDFDNLRRMAYYYVEHQQPIPFDVALLGQMEVYADNDCYRVKVPAVSRHSRDPAHRNPLPAYVVRETPAVAGVLAGRCPWLTLGWDYPRGELFRDDLYDHHRDSAGLLRPSSFTTFAADLGRRMVGVWNLRRW
jgi:hypothetical protein